MSAPFKEAKAMIGNGIRLPDAAEPYGTRATREANNRFRLLIVMAQGPAGALPEAWRSYAQIEDARASALEALRNPKVLHVAIVEDGSETTNPLRLVEWLVLDRQRRNGIFRKLLLGSTTDQAPTVYTSVAMST
jgi:hypothetical protein